MRKLLASMMICILLAGTMVCYGEAEYTRPEYVLGDTLDSFTISINGLVYQFPCPMSVFLNDGWVAWEEAELDAMVEPDITKNYHMNLFWETPDNGIIAISYYNDSEEAKPVRDCSVVGAGYFREWMEIILPGNFVVPDDTVYYEDVIAKYGEPTRTRMNYDIGDTGLCYWNFELKMGNLDNNYMWVVNHKEYVEE